MTRRDLGIALVCAAGLMPAALAQKSASPRPPDTAQLAEENVKQLLLLMDTDKNGKISKQEWMKFMDQEFDRLDKDKTGELDRNELLQSMISVRHPRHSIMPNRGTRMRSNTALAPAAEFCCGAAIMRPIS